MRVLWPEAIGNEVYARRIFSSLQQTLALLLFTVHAPSSGYMAMHVCKWNTQASLHRLVNKSLFIKGALGDKSRASPSSQE